MLSTTQFIIFEVGSECNLGHLHERCPNSIRIPTSSHTLTDELILRCIEEAYTLRGFTGLIGWHYYNEPMLEHERIFSLMERYSKGRYVLWTNGTIQPDDLRISLFEQVYCTDYGGVDSSYYKGCKNVSMFTPKFDERLLDTRGLPESGVSSCWRQHTEFIIDNWGTAHLCCQDWRGEIMIGNIWEDTYTTLIERRYDILKQMRRGEYSERCYRCNEKIKRVAKFDKEIRERTINHV